MIRRGRTENDKKSAYKLWSQCFTDSISYVDFYFKEKFDLNNLFIFERDGKILGSAHFNPYIHYYFQKERKSLYLLAAGTFPQYRGQGVFKEIMECGEQYARENSIGEIFLIPSNPEIYLPYGYHYTHYISHYSIKLKDILDAFKQSCEIEELTQESAEDLFRETADYINNTCRKYFSFIKKDVAYVKFHLKEINFENGFYYILRKNGQITGSFSYRAQENEILVEDLHWESKEALHSILNFLKGFREYYEMLTIKTHSQSQIEKFFTNEKTITKKIVPLLMTKIIDFEIALADYFKGIDFKENIYLKIENVGNFYWNGTALSHFSENYYDIEFSVAGATKFLYNSASLETLIALGEIEIKNEKLLLSLSEKKYYRASYIIEYV